jgi:hypothetical protein
MSRVSKAAAVLALAVLSPTAQADVGLPMVAVFLPPLWLAFVPIVLLEAMILRRLMATPLRRALLSTFAGNFVSSLVGIPLTWVILAALELTCCGAAFGLSTLGSKVYAVTVQAPWLIPYEKDLSWMVPWALVAMAVPCFMASVLIEAPINRLFFKSAPSRAVWRATAIANACSYLLLGLLIWPARLVADRLSGVFGPVIEWFAELTFRIAGVLTGNGH